MSSDPHRELREHPGGAPSPYGPPPRSRPQWTASAAIVTVLAAMLGGLGFGVHRAYSAVAAAERRASPPPGGRVTGSPGSPRTPTLPLPGLPSAAPRATVAEPGGPEYLRVTEVCALVSERTLDRLVAEVPSRPGRTAGGWTCSRSARERGDAHQSERAVTLTVRLAAARPGRTATQAMADEFARGRELARGAGPGRVFTRGRGPYAEVPDVGEEAYSQYAVTGIVAASGAATVTARTRNAVVTIEYRGHRTPVGRHGLLDYGAARPLADAPARRGAVAVAREALAALAACGECTR